MKAAHPTSSEAQATTPASHLRAIGGALIGYLIAKTPEARQHLEQVAETAQSTGNLSAADADVVHQVLAKPLAPKHSATLYPLN